MTSEVQPATRASLLPIRSVLDNAYCDLTTHTIDLDTHQLVKHAPEALLTILTSLWDALLDLRDNSSAVPSVLELLSTMIDFQTRADPNRTYLLCAPPCLLMLIRRAAEVLHCHSEGISLAELVARFWPFLRHMGSTIRQAVLRSVSRSGFEPINQVG